MTPTKNGFAVLLAMAFVAGFLGTAQATSGRLTSFNSTYGTAGTPLDSCSTCHTSVPALNSYGIAENNVNDNFQAVENLDSDGDGFTNIQEIRALTFPGDSSSHPAAPPPPPDSTTPVVTAFMIPASSASFTVPISSFTATDDVGVTGYLVTLSSSAPSVNATGWMASAPTSFTVNASGTVTLWAWAKDAAGNVSAGVNASTDVTATGGGGGGQDTVPPVVTTFTLPASSSSRRISITSFTASDDVGVTGYLVTSSSRKPRANSTRWNSQPPTSFRFREDVRGRVTLHAWAKDAVGNISEPAQASTSIASSEDDDGDDDGEIENPGGASGHESGDDSGSGDEGSAISPGAAIENASQNAPGTDQVTQMGIWVSRWFKVAIQNPAVPEAATTGFLKFQSWNEDAGIMQATLFTRNDATEAWQSVDLELNVTGSPMHFLASFEHASEFAFSASVIGSGSASNLRNASLQAVGISHLEHLAVMNGRSGSGPITISGVLLSKKEIPRQILH